MDIPGQKTKPLQFLSYEFNLRLIFVLLITHIYILLFKELAVLMGASVPIFSLIPVALSGWVLGLRGGFLVGIAILPINIFLQNVLFPTTLLHGLFIASSVLNIFAGCLVGWLSDSLEKANRHYQERLETEKTLRKAIEREQDLHEQLNQEKEDVEEKVRQRTAQLEEERSRLESSINSLNIGFIITDTKSNIVNMNSTAKRLLCLTEIGKVNSSGVLLDPLAINYECSIKDVETQLKDSFDFRGNLEKCFKERKLIDVGDIEFRNLFLHILMSPIVLFKNSELKVIGTVIVVEDLTQKTILERSKDEFFSIASHELRTPLTSIRGNTALIKDYYADILKKDKNLSEMVEDIHASSIRLIEIVNDFLDTSRLEQGRMVFNKTEFNFKELSEEVVKELNGIVAERKLYLKMESDAQLPKVYGDRDRIKQVLINLVGNSLKFTEKGGVTIKLEDTKPYLKVLVSDTGRGIDPKNQKLLFQKFQQAGSSLLTRDTTKGTGLGLYISKKIMEGNGGTIGLERATLGKGTTFAFTVPYVTAGEKVKVFTK